MEFSLVLLIFIISVIASVFQKLSEARKRKEEESGRKRVKVEDLPESTRRVLFGPQEDEDKTVAPKRTTAEEVPVPTMKDLFDVLTGHAKQRAQDDEEGEWRPLVEPEQRREIPRQLQQPMQRRTTTAQRTSTSRQVTRRSQPSARRVDPRRATTQPAERKPTPERARRPAAKAPTRQRRAEPSRKQGLSLFDNLDDVRRGIVMSEILGTPKGLQDDL